jgi:transposase-like protein
MAMVEADRTQLKDNVEVDETYIFTAHSGRGRTMKGVKALIVGAVEILTSKKNPTLSGRIRLRAIPSANSKSLQTFIMDHVEKNSIVKTDGWKGYGGLKQRGYRHVPLALNKPADAYRKLPRIHRVFSNLQNWLTGTHRFVSQKHLQNYLNEFAYRYNARYDPINAFNKVLLNTTGIEPRTYREFAKVEKPVYVNPEVDK